MDINGIEINNTDRTFKPTVGWMAQRYNDFNKTLFGGELGDCEFGVFTSGRGSQGSCLGWFKITGSSIYISRSTRRMYKEGFFGDEYVDRNNFVRFCKPKIELNGNYSGTEYGFTATLIHEMCHYYTYMYGYAPKQAHGREFKEIGYIVSRRSNGTITISRLASAEEMSNLDLSDEMKQKKEKRISNKKASVTLIVSLTNGNVTKFSIVSNKNLVDEISSTWKNRGENVITTNDAEIINFLFSNGYKRSFRTFRYWSASKNKIAAELQSLLYKKGLCNGKESSELPSQNTDDNSEVKTNATKRIFSIKTNNGVFECNGDSYYTLLKTLKERFPKLNADSINKLINNPNNYRMNENANKMKHIIENVINEFINKEIKNNEVVAITPDMNLGLESPLENNNNI